MTRMLSSWLSALAAAAAAQLACAVPFTVELTIPKATGYLLAQVPDAPNTPFTAPHIVLRVTGDTANVVYRRAEGASIYQVSTTRVEIPGIGSGIALGRDVAVSAGMDRLEITSPAYITAFDMGAYAIYPVVPGYDLDASLGPLTPGSAATFRFGPTSAMIPFTTDDGVHGTVAAGISATGGGTLKITVGGNAPNPLAARRLRDLEAFAKATGPNRVATFEENTSDASGGVAFPEGLLQVVQSVNVSGTARPHAYWFGTTGTPTHFALNAGAPSAFAARFEAVFPEPVLAAGFLFNCYQCNATTLPYGVVWTTRDADGNAGEHGTTVVDLPAGAQQPGPAFFGLTTTRPFRRLTIEQWSPFGGVQPWMIDDLRFATTLPAIEYHHASFDHYFVTSIADEIAKLDDGTFAGWKRTGLQFNVGASSAPGSRPVCRLFSTAFGAKSSHFYSSDAAECALRSVDPAWQFEGIVFGVALPDVAGMCTDGTVPLYRLYNDGQGGAPNHRYTTSAAVRQAMVAAGWISEGTGPFGEIGCVVQ